VPRHDTATAAVGIVWLGQDYGRPVLVHSPGGFAISITTSLPAASLKPIHKVTFGLPSSVPQSSGRGRLQPRRMKSSSLSAETRCTFTFRLLRALSRRHWLPNLVLENRPFPLFPLYSPVLPVSLFALLSTPSVPSCPEAPVAL
jgi:hypothetical protein